MGGKDVCWESYIADVSKAAFDLSASRKPWIQRESHAGMRKTEKSGRDSRAADVKGRRIRKVLSSQSQERDIGLPIKMTKSRTFSTLR